MKKLQTKNSIKLEFFSKQKEIEKYAQVGQIAHELFHDLLNPITGFILYMDLFKDDEIIPADIHQHAQQINESIYRIRKFIKLIQESVMTNNGKQVIDLNKNIRNMMSILFYKAKNNNVSIILLTNEKIKIKMEEIKLYQIIINLLSNAIDSYDNICDNRKKQIIIKTISSSEEILICVKDNGCGIEKKNLSKIFETNYTTKRQGLGLGLKTTKKIVRKDLGGKITANSLINHGTEFKISIPKNHL